MKFRVLNDIHSKEIDTFAHHEACYFSIAIANKFNEACYSLHYLCNLDSEGVRCSLDVNFRFWFWILPATIMYEPRWIIDEYFHKQKNK